MATEKKCHSDFDCMGLAEESCCVAVTKLIGICKPKVTLYSTCHPHSMKFILLLNGGIARNFCGCQVGLICKTMTRKNWHKWNDKKKERKSRYKNRCRTIPKEDLEFQEK